MIPSFPEKWTKDFNATSHPWNSMGSLPKMIFQRAETLAAEGLAQHPALISYDDNGEECDQMTYQELCVGHACHFGGAILFLSFPNREVENLLKCSLMLH